MSKGRYFLERLNEGTAISGQPIPGQTVLEIAGDCRVLIENHFGVKEYSHERITVNVKFGCISICGCRLELVRMTKEQLVICGRIDGVSLQRRE